MSSRALSLAAVLLLIGSFAPKPALAQENLDAGKTPSQLFAGTCNACHKSPRGLLKTVPPSSLPSFLRQHYTTSPNMAGALASYLVSNGAADTRIGGDGPKGAKGSREGTKEGAKQQEAKQEARPEPRQGGQSEQLDRWGRRVHPQEGNAPAAEPRPEGAEQAATDRGPDGRKNAKQKLTKRGRPVESLPKEEPAAAVEAPKTESRPDKPDETAGRDETRPDTGKPAEDDRSQSAKVEQPPEPRVLRPDPVPSVTPAPTTAAAPSAPPAPASTPVAAPVQAAASEPVTEMAVPLPAGPTAPAPPPPPVAASAPPQPPLPPAGPPAPPISQ
jgi:hypothetical protein